MIRQDLRSHQGANALEVPSPLVFVGRCLQLIRLSETRFLRCRGWIVFGFACCLFTTVERVTVLRLRGGVDRPGRALGDGEVMRVISAGPANAGEGRLEGMARLRR